MCIIKQTDMFRWTECWGLIEENLEIERLMSRNGLDCRVKVVRRVFCAGFMAIAVLLSP